MKATLSTSRWASVVVLALALSFFPSHVLGEFIQPVAVLVSNGEATQDALINGQGFEEPGLGSPSAVHSRTSSEMWSGIGSIRESAIFDLGQAFGLTKVYIWNYNAPDATDVGMKDVEVQVSSDSDMTKASFNTIARIALKEGGDTAQVFDVLGTQVRLVRLKGLSNWGQGYTVGLAEVRFETGSITGNVPTVKVTAPRDADEIKFGSDIAIEATVSDRDGISDVARLEFFDGDTLITNRVAASQTVMLRQPARGDHTLRVVATDKSGKTAWVNVIVTVRELVADRIAKIDDTADEGTGMNQVRYQGAWNLAQGVASDPRYNNNDHYNASNNRNDYFEVKFTGVKIDLFATVASHHGSGWASIDGGPESKVNYKATQRAEQVFVWGSPILPNREHTLRVRLAGDGVVTADRFDVSVSDKPDVALASVKSVAFGQLVLQMEDVGASVVDQTTVKLSLDGVPVTASVVKSGTLTTITYTPGTPFPAGSSHAAKVEAKDKTGANLTSELTFNLPAPFFPVSGLGIPAGAAGAWGLRQVWGGGRVDAVVSAVELVLKATQPGFEGKNHDTTVPWVNLALSSNPGTSGLFAENQPFPAEEHGLTAADFAFIGQAYVRFPRSGDWTIGVHSDDGFALRVVGHPFDSVSGAGARDDDFPEYIGFLTETGDGNTRGVLKGLTAGDYRIEFVAFQRVGGAHCEIYAAEGALAEDSDTDQWQLIGAPGGLEIVPPPVAFEIQQWTVASGQLTLQFQSPHPSGQHQLLESPDLKSWQPSAGVTFIPGANNTVRVVVPIGSSPAKFLRIARR